MAFSWGDAKTRIHAAFLEPVKATGFNAVMQWFSIIIFAIFGCLYIALVAIYMPSDSVRLCVYAAMSLSGSLYFSAGVMPQRFARKVARFGFLSLSTAWLIAIVEQYA